VSTDYFVAKAMSQELTQNLSHLDCELGAKPEDIRRAYRLMSFIWHPDRHPETYAQVAQDKIQKINSAYEWLVANEDLLVSSDHIEGLQLPSAKVDSSYEVKSSDCLRCHGSGEVAKEVSWNGEFETESCSVCLGSGKVVVDDRNACRDCEGQGLNQKSGHQDRHDWIDAQMRTKGWFDRNLNPNEYKRLWLQFHQEKMICSSCHGSGYFFHKPNLRQEERRRVAPTDFLRDLEGKGEDRRTDRRQVG
jgi:DnaJ-class molecular chaperone